MNQTGVTTIVPRLNWGDPVESDGDFLLPVGTVVLMLADVEGSTRRWEQGEADMADAMGRLSAIATQEIGRHHGVRPPEQGEGDSFVGAFARASEAVACALAIQAGAPLPVRIGVHTGEAQRTPDGTYVGPALNRAARLRDAAHGGQVVLSQTTADLVAERLPSGAGLLDLGVHRLKDLSRPERVFQLTHPSLGATFPPLRTLDAYRHNLPAQRDSFVGRTNELHEVRTLLADASLVTLTGTGGCGKTRLAVHVAASLLDDHPDGVFFADLSTARDQERLVAIVQEALGIGDEAPAALEPYLRHRTLLLVLDNCEQVVAECASLCDRLLSSAPGLRVLATSRERLGVHGESAYHVPSLDVPPSNEVTGIDALTHFAAVELFVDRARRARATFAPTDEEAAAIADVCRRLEGIPLAIELAAARTLVLTPAADRRRPRRAVPAADRRRADGDAAAADASGVDRLVARPAHRAGAGDLPPVVGLLRRLVARGRRTGVLGTRRAGAAGARPAHVARRQVAGGRRDGRRASALPDARDRAAVRGRPPP
jgi:class 3 adenylate cyclase